MAPTVKRRKYLKTCGTIIGGGVIGTSTVAAQSTKRFIVDTKNVSNATLEEADLDIIHNITEINVAAVRGKRKEVKKVTSKFAPDATRGINLPTTKAPIEASGSSVSGEATASDEPFYPYQWDKQVQDIPSAHEITRGENTRVAIIDSGVAATHPDLEHAVNADLSRNFTNDGFGAPGPYGYTAPYHGTHVAGIVAANDQNETGVVGTAPQTEIIDCRVFAWQKLAFLSDELAAIVYAANIDCDAANLGVANYASRKRIGIGLGKLYNRATTYATQKGTLLTIPAGNRGADLQHDKDRIALSEITHAMTVSATGPIGFRWDADGDGNTDDFEELPKSPASYTNYGTNVIDIGAPGGDIKWSAIGTGVPWYQDFVLSTFSVPIVNDDGEPTEGVRHSYAWVTGTSMSGPQATGAAALVQSYRENAHPEKVKSMLKRAASVPDGYDKTYYGSGFLDPVTTLENSN